MNDYINAEFLKRIREEKNFTQKQLADILGVTDKAVSKWETGRGYPDISLLPSLAKTLDLSVTELISGESNRNTNKHANMHNGSFYICPVCGNIIYSVGKATVSCCGITLIPEETEDTDENHIINIEKSENEYYVTCMHSMTKEHFISFIAAVSDRGVHIVKQYPEMESSAYFQISGTRYIYAYCNKHGLFRTKIRK